MQNNQSNDALIFLIAIPVAAFIFVGWKISNYLGADFQTTLIAVAYSVFIVGGAGLLWWFVRPHIAAVSFGAGVLIWPKWWGVLDSAANGGAGPSDFHFSNFENPWWNAGWFNWGAEAALIIGAAYFVYVYVNDPYT